MLGNNPMLNQAFAYNSLWSICITDGQWKMIMFVCMCRPINWNAVCSLQDLLRNYKVH